RWVAGKNAVIDTRLASFLPRTINLIDLLVLEDTNHADHCLRVIACLGDVLRPEMVRLELHVATVATQQRLSPDVGEVGNGRTASEDCRAGAEDSRQCLVGLLAHLVSCTHMPDLMAQNRRKLSFIV